MTHTAWSIPDAKPILSAKADKTPAWIAARRQGIGGSDSSVLFGESRYQSLYGLWLDKTGQAQPFEGNDATRRGEWLEPHLAKWFAGEVSVPVRRCGLLQSHERPHMLATLDRLTGDGGVLEIKTVHPNAHSAAEWKRGGIARHAYIQAQHQLAVSGRSHAWFVIWQDPTPQRRGPIARDESLISEILQRADDFWFNHVITRIPPPVDLASITDEELRLRWPTAIDGKTVEAEYPQTVLALIAERDAYKKSIKDTQEQLAEVETSLKTMIADAEALTIDGRPVIAYKTVTRHQVSTTALRLAEPDIAQQFTVATVSRQLTTPGFKEAA